jgi:hypothetical protein
MALVPFLKERYTTPAGFLAPAVTLPPIPKLLVMPCSRPDANRLLI